MTAPPDPAGIRHALAIARHVRRGDRDAVAALLDSVTRVGAVHALLLVAEDAAARSGETVDELLDSWITAAARTETRRA